MSRRLDDRIRKLCADVVQAQENSAEEVIEELKSALREHTARLRQMAAARLTAVKGQSPDRRSYKERRAEAKS
jgi:hypothetical protein